MACAYLKRISLRLITSIALSTIMTCALAHNGMVVIQTDFGLKDGAVSSMKGVMQSVDKKLVISDLTHEITPFNIWEASYRLHQTVSYWPAGTVFVSVVDPGVGTARKSIVALDNQGHYYVTPDNGTLTLIEDNIGIKEARQIDETKNRLKNSFNSYTFHGRDVYGYTAARLASGKIAFEEVGPKLTTPILRFNYQRPFIKDKGIYGTIVILDPQYGNLWTNINSDLAKKFGLIIGKKYTVRIFDEKSKIYQGTMTFQHTFGEVSKGEALVYTNSLMDLAIGTNQENFAHKYNIAAGPNWHIEIDK